MKVIHRSGQLLVMECRPRLIGILLIGAVLRFLFGAMAHFPAGRWSGALMLPVVGVPLLTGAMMVRRVRPTFDRGAGQITRTGQALRRHHAANRTAAESAGGSHALHRLPHQRPEAPADR
jgi:hypothetical protein